METKAGANASRRRLRRRDGYVALKSGRERRCRSPCRLAPIRPSANWAVRFDKNYKWSGREDSNLAANERQDKFLRRIGRARSKKARGMGYSIFWGRLHYLHPYVFSMAFTYCHATSTSIWRGTRYMTASPVRPYPSPKGPKRKSYRSGRTTGYSRGES